MFLVMVAVMPFISCSSDDDNNNSGGQDQLVGKWRKSKEIVKRYADDELIASEDNAATETDYLEMDIKADGTFTEINSFSYHDENGELVVETFTDSGIYTVSGNEIVFLYAAEEGSDTGGTDEWLYSFSGEVLTLYEITETVTNNTVYREEYSLEYIKQ